MTGLDVLLWVALAAGPRVGADSLPGLDQDVDRLVEALNRGHLILDQAPFRPERPELEDGVEPILRQTATALSRAPGRFVVVVPPEREPRLPPDTVLSRRRAEEAFRRLLGAGSNRNRLVGMVQPPTIASVPPGRARIELFRID